MWEITNVHTWSHTYFYFDFQLSTQLNSVELWVIARNDLWENKLRSDINNMWMMNIYGMYVSNIAVCIHSSLIWEGKYFDPGANCDQDRLLGQSATPPLHGVISQIRHHTVQCSSGSKVNILNVCVFEEFLENVLIFNKFTLVLDLKLPV